MLCYMCQLYRVFCLGLDVFLCFYDVFMYIEIRMYACTHVRMFVALTMVCLQYHSVLCTPYKYYNARHVCILLISTNAVHIISAQLDSINLL